MHRNYDTIREKKTDHSKEKGDELRLMAKPSKEVRCTGKKTKGYRAGENCGKLLGVFEKAIGQIKCTECGTLNNVKV